MEAVVLACVVPVAVGAEPRLGNMGPGCLGCSVDCIAGAAGFVKREVLSAVLPPRLKPENIGGLLAAVWPSLDPDEVVVAWKLKAGGFVAAGWVDADVAALSDGFEVAKSGLDA